MKAIFAPTRNKLFFLIALLLLAIAFLSFRIYKAETNTTKRPSAQPAGWGMPTSLPDHIILTLTPTPATSQSITWRTDTTVSNAMAEIVLADAAPRFWKAATRIAAQTKKLDAQNIESSQMQSHYHAATFTNLLPDTTYAYRVGDGTHWSEWFHFKTASNQNKPFTFIYLGDAQNYILENYSLVIRGAFAKAPHAQFALHAGDMVHGAHNEKQWHEWHTAGGWLYASKAQMPATGNHEYGGYTHNEHKAKKRHLSVQWNHQFTLPQNGPQDLKEQAYYFDYQGARFITLNSNEKLKEQAAWLETVLKNNSQKWTVVYFHHPVFSAANHDDNKELRTLWQPLFEKYGVDLVLTGHEHSYTRGQAKTSAGAAGPVYVVSVSGGNMYYFKDKPWKEYNAQLQRKGENTQLYQVVNVSAQKIEFRSYTATGTLYDAFDLEKEANAKTAILKEYAGTLPPERTHQNTIAYKDKK